MLVTKLLLAGSDLAPGKYTPSCGEGNSLGWGEGDPEVHDRQGDYHNQYHITINISEGRARGNGRGGSEYLYRNALPCPTFYL